MHLYSVPQGSILGPILFSIYINDVFQIMNSLPVSLVLYADDATCIIESDNLNEAVITMKAALNHFHSWFPANRLKLNIAKTKCMVFTKN